MSQEFPEAHPLAKAIRAIRSRHGKSGVEFAALLGVNQAMVSRYETGRTRPGSLVLYRLLRLAEGPEKNPILDQFTRLVGGEQERLAEVSRLSEFEQMTRGLSIRSAFPPRQAPEGWSVVDAHTAFTPNLAELGRALSQLYARGREVDSSLFEIVKLWLSHDDLDAAVRQSFSVAAKYLEVALVTRAGQGTRQPKLGIAKSRSKGPPHDTTQG